jgi:hypothetical protein
MSDKTLINNYTLEGTVICEDPVTIAPGNSGVDGSFSLLTSMNMRYSEVTSSTYTVLNTDLVIGVNVAGTCVITLPSASVSAYDDNGTSITNGKHFIVLDASGNANSSTNKITINPNPNGNDTILGASSIEITSGYSSLTLFSNGGTSWFLL